MVAQIVGGLGIMMPRTARLASIVLAVVFAIFSLACVPGILKAPGVYGEYGSFFEQFSLFCGAIAAYALTLPDDARAKAFGRAARLGFGLSTISFTLAQLFYLQLTANLVPKWIPPNQMFWAILTTLAFGLAAIAILINWQARLALRLLTLMVVLFGLIVWVPILVAAPKAHFAWSEFALTFLIAGAAWIVSGLPSLRPRIA